VSEILKFQYTDQTQYSWNFLSSLVFEISSLRYCNPSVLNEKMKKMLCRMSDVPVLGLTCGQLRDPLAGAVWVGEVTLLDQEVPSVSYIYCPESGRRGNSGYRTCQSLLSCPEFPSLSVSEEDLGVTLVYCERKRKINVSGKI
jgi:hypothetical protein